MSGLCFCARGTLLRSLGAEGQDHTLILWDWTSFFFMSFAVGETHDTITIMRA